MSHSNKKTSKNNLLVDKISSRGEKSSKKKRGENGVNIPNNLGELTYLKFKMTKVSSANHICTQYFFFFTSIYKK